LRIGVVSDTHDNLRNLSRIARLFAQAEVERIVHTGDITRPQALEALAACGIPIHAVFGNNDERDALTAVAPRLGVELVEPPFEWSWHGRRIVVAHSPDELVGAVHEEHELVLHGHTHRRVVERRRSQLVFNPGESAGHVAGANAVGVVDLRTLEPDLLFF